MCQSAVSVISAKEGRKSSSIKLLEEGESQMEAIATGLETGLVPFYRLSLPDFPNFFPSFFLYMKQTEMRMKSLSYKNNIYNLY